MAEPKQDSLDKMWKYVKGFAEKSGTAMHPNPAVTEAVVKGLAMHVDELGKPLCPCNFYKDKQAEAKLRRWICACDDLQILPLSAVRPRRRHADYGIPAGRPRGAGSLWDRHRSDAGEGPRLET
jgi:hypothetical protein